MSFDPRRSAGEPTVDSWKAFRFAACGSSFISCAHAPCGVCVWLDCVSSRPMGLRPLGTESHWGHLGRTWIMPHRLMHLLRTRPQPTCEPPMGPGTSQCQLDCRPRIGMARVPRLPPPHTLRNVVG